MGARQCNASATVRMIGQVELGLGLIALVFLFLFPSRPRRIVAGIVADQPFNVSAEKYESAARYTYH